MSQTSCSTNHRLSRVENNLTAALLPPRILIVDDDPLTSELANSVDDKYRVVSVCDGREAYRLLKADADFAAAILSLNMPHLTGSDIIGYMKTEKRLIRIPVVIVSAEVKIENITSSLSAGAMAFLPKPFTVHRLAHILGLAVHHRSHLEEFRRAA